MTFVGHNTQLRWRLRSNRYDYLDRRVQKITPEATHTYFYDGWMLIKEIVANTNGTTDVIEYHWGKDLSGTIGGAGGVGGLLYLSISNSSTPNSSTRQLYIPFYDAYGNIMGYWDAQGNVVAQYTYDAFGKLISSGGPMADVFSFRYSTKYYDPETGFYYYGYRFYSPDLMRWITRDPIGEEGGVNLYAMCGNNAVNHFDALGEARMITGALMALKGSRRVNHTGYVYARKIIRLLNELNARKKNGRNLFNAEIKDFALTPLSIIKEEVRTNATNVYLIAHGGLDVNGKRWVGEYEWRTKDKVTELIFPYGANERGVDIKYFGPELKMENVFGCYLSPSVRKVPSGLIFKTYTSSKDDYSSMYQALYSALSKYKTMSPRCTLSISVYEGEDSQTIKLNDRPTDRIIQSYPLRDEEAYK